MSDYKVLIVGYGTVGQNLAKELSALKPFIYDKYHFENSVLPAYEYDIEENDVGDKIVTRNFSGHYNIAFICVDTPLVGDNKLDTTEVINAINENDADIYVIKSTVPVETTFNLRQKLGKKIVFSPEYYGSTQHCNNFDFNFTILGGEENDCIEVQQILQECYDARHTFHITDSETAEMVKFMENSWIATKVSFCNQFYELAKSYRINYEQLRELFILDPRVNPAHTFVYRDHPYWDSHCLNKDVAYIANVNRYGDFLRHIIYYNDIQKAVYKPDEPND